LQGAVVWALSSVMTLLFAAMTSAMAVRGGAAAGKAVAQAGQAAVEVGQAATQAAGRSPVSSAVAQGLGDTLAEQASQTIAQSAEGQVSAQEIRSSIRQLDQAILTQLSASLARGDTDSARQTLADNTELSEEKIRQVVEGMSASIQRQIGQVTEEAGEVAEQAGDYTSTALWVMVLASLFGLGAGAWGGAIGARQVAEMQPDDLDEDEPENVKTEERRTYAAHR
jgi:hypothetical protein